MHVEVDGDAAVSQTQWCETCLAHIAKLDHADNDGWSFGDLRDADREWWEKTRKEMETGE